MKNYRQYLVDNKSSRNENNIDTNIKTKKQGYHNNGMKNKNKYNNKKNKK